MKKNLFYCLFLAALCLILSCSCTQSVPAQEQPVSPSTPAPIVTTQDYQDPEQPGMGGLTDPKVPLVAKKGQGISISIASNPITGYSWHLAEPLNWQVVALNKIGYFTPFHNGIPTTTGGREVWGLKALAPGTAKVKVKYIRPWEPNAQPRKEMEFTIIVQ